MPPIELRDPGRMNAARPHCYQRLAAPDSEILTVHQLFTCCPEEPCSTRSPSAK